MGILSLCTKIIKKKTLNYQKLATQMLKVDLDDIHWNTTKLSSDILQPKVLSFIYVPLLLLKKKHSNIKITEID